MTKLDVPFVRSQFPAFSEPSLQGWAFFENAGGSYPCRQVVTRLTDFYTKNKVQPYYAFPASQKAGELMDAAYRRMAAYLNVEEGEIHFGPSTTQNTYVLAHAMRPMWQEGDEIIVSCQDHEANAGAWRRLASRGIRVVEWHVHPQTGMLDPNVLEGLFSDRTRMVAFPHCSNLIGHVNPVQAISHMARARGALCVVDGVAYAPHGLPDLKALGADIYLFSLYKTFGPHLGLMYVRKGLLAQLENQSHFFKEGVARNMLTPAGPDHAQIAAANGVLDYLDAVYAHHFVEDAPPAAKNRQLNGLFQARERELLEPLMAFLRSREDVRILGPTGVEGRAPTIGILPLKRDIGAVYAALTRQQLMLGIGNFYAVRPLMELGIALQPGVLRISFLHYTTADEIGQLVVGLERALRIR